MDKLYNFCSLQKLLSFCVKKSLVVFSVENHNKTNLVVKHSLKRADEEEAEEGKIFSPKVGEALTECPAGPSSCQH